MSRDVIVSVRLTEEEAEFLAWRAGALGTTVSEQVRQAIEKLPAHVVRPVLVPPSRRQVGWECPHANVTYSALPQAAPQLPCGCRMTPVFANQSKVAS